MRQRTTTMALTLGLAAILALAPAVAVAEDGGTQADAASIEETAQVDGAAPEGEELDTAAGELAAASDEEAATEGESEEGADAERNLDDREGDSFRFRDGQLIEDMVDAGGEGLGGDDLSAMATGAWSKNSSGQYVSSDGSVIVGALRRGVDVSEWQDKIDWAKAKGDDVGFAIIRCGYTGSSSRQQHKDAQFENNAAGLQANGIPYGVYFFSQAYTVADAIKEADYTISLLKGKTVTLPVYYDLEVEDVADKLSNDELYAITKAFCDRISAAGYTPGVYSSLSWWDHHLTGDRYDAWTRWVAQYYSKCQYDGDYDIWQCSNAGKIAGIDGNVDMNIDYGVAARMEGADAESTVWTRLYGPTAIGTMQAIVEEGWSSSPVAVLATKEGYWDALSASSLAGSVDCPVLLTGKDGLDDITESEINRLGVQKVYVIGGTNALSEQVDVDLYDLDVEEVVRVAGKDAAATACEVMNELPKHADTCIIATSHGYWDALSASPISYDLGMPIFLTSGDYKLSSATLDVIKAGGFKKAIIVGGTAAIPTSVEDQLKSIGIAADSITRRAGATAIETSSSIAEYGISLGMGANKVGVATSHGYWDALTGAALCGKDSAVLILVNGTNGSSISTIVAKYANAIKQGRVFGGNRAVSNTTFNTLVGVTG